MKISIKKQFSLVVSVLVVISVVLISVFLFVYIKNAVDEKMKLAVNNTVVKCADELESKIDNIIKLNEGLCNDKRLFEIASYKTDDFFERKDTNREFTDEYNKLTRLLMNGVYNRYASALYVYENYPISNEYNSNKIYDFLGSSVFQTFNRLDKDSQLNNMDLKELKLISLDNKNIGLIFAQKIFDKSTYLYEPLGVNIIQIDIETHLKNYKEIDMVSDMTSFITDSKGNLLYCDRDADIAELSSFSKKIGEFELGKLNNIDDQNNLIGVYPIGLGLRLCTYINTDFMKFEIKNILLRVSLMILLFLILLIFAVHFLFGRMTNQIHTLSQMMLGFDENVKTNDVIRKEHKVIEIQNLYDSFDNMSNKIKFLIQEAHLQGVKEKEMEMKLLQSQIKPHFLYNALDAVSWLAIKNNQRDIVDIVSALSDNFRYSIKDSDKLISVGDEINFIIDFLCLQELVRKNRIKIQVDIAEKTKKLFIPKFLIQPIVENSVIHGMNENIESFVINLTANTENGKLVLDISDNGCGDDDNKLNKYLNGDKNIFASEKIGIKNVNQRIKLKFGNEYGLSYINKDEFFVAQITIPVIKSAS